VAYFPFGGRKGSFLGVLHAQKRDAAESYTRNKVVIERRTKEGFRNIPERKRHL